MSRLVILPDLYDDEISPETTILQILLKLNVRIHFSCRRGLCGQDLIHVVSGVEHLCPVSDLEEGTLELLRAGKDYRMACCTRVIGDGVAVIEVV